MPGEKLIHHHNGIVDSAIREAFPGDGIAQVIAGTLVDRGHSMAAAISVAGGYEYDPIGQVIDECESRIVKRTFRVYVGESMDERSKYAIVYVVAFDCDDARDIAMNAARDWRVLVVEEQP